MNFRIILPVLPVILSFLFISCTSPTGNATAGTGSATTASSASQYGGYASQKEWGEHLVPCPAAVIVTRLKR